MTSLPSVHHNHSCSPFTQEVVCAALTARLDEWPEICVALASVLYPYFFRSRSLPAILQFYWLGERTSYCESAHRMANRSCAVWALGNDMFQSASTTLLNCMVMSLGTALLFHWFVILLILETPASPCQCGKCGVITNSSYFSVATVSLINYCVCRNQLNFMNSAKTDMTTGCNCNCTLSER